MCIRDRGYAEEMTLPAGTYYIDICGNKGPYTIKAVYAPEADGSAFLFDMETPGD